MGRRNLREKVAALFELPGDVVADRSRITLVGAAELLVENHRGLTEYTPGSVVLMVPEGQMSVRGDDLQINSIAPEQVVISGKIRTIQYNV